MHRMYGKHHFDSVSIKVSRENFKVWRNLDAFEIPKISELEIVFQFSGRFKSIIKFWHSTSNELICSQWFENQSFLIAFYANMTMLNFKMLTQKTIVCIACLNKLRYARCWCCKFLQNTAKSRIWFVVFLLKNCFISTFSAAKH